MPHGSHTISFRVPFTASATSFRRATRYRTILTRMAHSVIAGGMNELLLG